MSKSKEDVKIIVKDLGVGDGEEIPDVNGYTVTVNVHQWDVDELPTVEFKSDDKPYRSARVNYSNGSMEDSDAEEVASRIMRLTEDQ